MSDMIREKLLVEINSNKEISEVNLSENIIKEYLKWINYIPDWWNLNDSSEKSVELMRRRVIELKYKPLFEKYLVSDNMTPEEVYKIYMYTMAIPIDKYASMKLSAEELDECIRVSEIYKSKSGYELELFILELGSKKNRSMKDEYLLHILKGMINMGILLHPYRIKDDEFHKKLKRALKK